MIPNKTIKIFIHFCIQAFLLFILVTPSIAADNQALKNTLQQILTHAVNHSSKTPGAVLYIESPQLGVMQFAAGFADKENRIPMSIDNNFRLASMSKTFLAVTLLKMAEQQMINLDDKASAYLPESLDLNRIANGNEVTVRQLMQMRSGIPNYTDYDAYTTFIDNHQDHVFTPIDGLQMLYDEPPNFTSDKKYEYSNSNYLLLQLIVEQITHQDYASVIHQYIIDPLHLKHTFIEMHDKHDEGVNGLTTNGYDEDENYQLKDVTAYNDGFGTADGGIISTASDLAIFIKALLQTKTLLSQQMLKQMLTPLGTDEYGLGIYAEDFDGEFAWTHNGASSGFNGQYYYFPSHQLLIIILTNSYASDIIDDVASNVFKAITE